MKRSTPWVPRRNLFRFLGVAIAWFALLPSAGAAPVPLKELFSIQVEKPGSGGVAVVQFCPNGECVLTVSLGKQVNLWDVKTKKIRASLTVDDSVKSAVIHSDNSTVAIATSVGVIIWDTKAGKKAQPKHIHTNAPNGSVARVDVVAFRDAGDMVAAVSPENTIYFIDIKSGKIKSKVEMEDGYIYMPSNVSFTKSGKSVVVYSRNGMIIVQVETGKLVGASSKDDMNDRIIGFCSGLPRNEEKGVLLSGYSGNDNSNGSCRRVYFIGEKNFPKPSKVIKGIGGNIFQSSKLGLIASADQAELLIASYNTDPNVMTVNANILASYQPAAGTRGYTFTVGSIHPDGKTLVVGTDRDDGKLVFFAMPPM